MTKVAEELREILNSTPAPRSYLCYQLTKRLNRNIDDRTLRGAKKELILAGVPVCSNSHVKGYYIGSTEERKHTANEMRKRARELWAEAEAIDPAEIEGQVRWMI